MLSKIMSTAALIAASTALASAATVVFTTASSVSGATETVTLDKKADAYDGYDKDATAPDKKTYSYTAGTSFGDSALSFKYSISGGKVYITETSTSTNSNSALDSAFAEATGLSLSDYAGQKIYGAGGAYSAATLTFSGLKANTEYRFSFVGAGRSSSGTLAITTGTLSSTDRGGGSFYGLMSENTTPTDVDSSITLANSSVTETTTDSDGKEKEITKYNATAATIVVTSDANGNVVFTSDSWDGSSSISNGSKPGFVAIAVSDVIPEPSAFGLLAGIGALALAVSRRKRRA